MPLVPLCLPRTPWSIDPQVFACDHALGQQHVIVGQKYDVSVRIQKVATEDLVPFAAQVDSGVAELIRKQEAGWSIVRVSE